MDSTSKRIWRTVVFSGAMLGAPLAVADTKAPAKTTPTKPAPPPDQVEAQKEIDAASKRVDEAAKAVASAQSQADRDLAQAKLAAAKKAKADAEAKLANLKKPQTPIQKLEKELADVDKRVTAAVDAVVAAQNDADRTTAKAKLDSLRKEKAGIESRLAAEKAKVAAPKRPRTDDSDRPIGRGFVLS